MRRRQLPLRTAELRIWPTASALVRALVFAFLLASLGCAGTSSKARDSEAGDVTRGVDGLGPDGTSTDQQGDVITEDQTSADLTSEDASTSDADAGIEFPPIAGTKVFWNYPENGAFTEDTFFDYPFPESRRYDPDGTIALGGFPHPNPNYTDCPTFGGSEFYLDLIFDFVTARQFRQYVIDTADRYSLGFGTNSAIYLRFDGRIDPNSLPDPAQSLLTTATVFLIDVDPESPTRGERRPISIKQYAANRYVKNYTVAALPFVGFPLRPNTQYALVVRRQLQDVNAQPLGVPEAFQALKRSENDGSTQALLYKGVFDYLDGLGVLRADIAAMTVFRTGDPTKLMRPMATKVEALESTYADVTIDSASWDKAKQLIVINGSFNTVIVQKNTPPYLPPIDVPNLSLDLDPDNTDGIALFDKSIQTSSAPLGTAPRLERIPFVLAIPGSAFDLATLTEKTVTDIPLVLYAHGTGGSRNSVLNAVAQRLGELGIASFGIDQVMHGVRAHSETLLDLGLANLGLEEVVESGTLFFNPLNLHAAMGNVMQSAVDYIWQAKFLPQTPITVEVTLDHDNDPNTTDVTLTRTLIFDASRVYFMGHSQGSLFAPLLATSKRIKGLMLSAPGGHLASSLLTKTQPDKPIPIVKVIEYLVCDEEKPTIHHPLMSVFATLFEPVDAINFMRMINLEPESYGAKHLFITQGTTDSYATPPTNEALTTAGRLRQVGPLLAVVGGQTLLGLTVYNQDLSGNVEGQSKLITSGFKQYHGELPACKDDHYVYTCVPQAPLDWMKFFETMISTDLPLIPAGPFN
ncbi:MAG: hypothetical protein KC609_12830 [Myxococcales bacterium]|nr:hypothetical protein [Myxococcales bacterium]